MKSNQEIEYDCKNATLLIEKELQTRLSIRESVELKLHLAGCSVCRLYQSQTIVIGSMVKQILNHRKGSALDNQYKAELQQQIEVELKIQNKKGGK